MTRRRVTLALAVVLVAGSLVGVAAWRLTGTACLDRSAPADSLSRPLPKSEDDPRLARLVAAAEGWGQGPVIGAIGYDYDRYVDVAALPDLFAVWRKDDPVMTTVDAATGDPVWGIDQAQVRRTWDASADRFLTVTAPEDAAAQLSAFDMASGKQRWCVELDQPALSADDPISTGVDSANNVLVLAGSDHRLSMLAAADGDVLWSRTMTGVDRADYLSAPWSGVVIVGGRAAHELADEPATGAEVIAAIDEADGEVLWRHEVADGATASVVGDIDGQVVVREAMGGRHRLLMLDHESGSEQWEVASVPATADIAVRGSRVLIRTESTIRALDVGTGKPVWRIPVRQQPQQFPYGFRLSSQPMPDAEHVLLGATDALIEVDLRDGSRRRFRLPSDGISTTYWPYRVVLSGQAMAVATNTGAVVVGAAGG